MPAAMARQNIDVASFRLPGMRDRCSHAPYYGRFHPWWRVVEQAKASSADAVGAPDQFCPGGNRQACRQRLAVSAAAPLAAGPALSARDAVSAIRGGARRNPRRCRVRTN